MVESQLQDSKSHLIQQICGISNHATSCAHRDSNPFIDWYILLQVDDNVGVDIIRKKYHKYALLLHPDKNKHPKAEFAFKLVSEAYACLSDESRRLEFDRKRWNNLCSECMNTPQTSTKVKGLSSSSDRSKWKKISARLKEVKARFIEEARVIDRCLKNNGNVNIVDVFEKEKEIPVFDPKDYASLGYPHFGVWRCSHEPVSLRWLKKRFNYEIQQQTKVKCDSPIFECKSNKTSFRRR